MKIVTFEPCKRRTPLMLHVLAVAILLVGSTFLGAAHAAPASRTVDLDEPGVLEALQSSNPTHYDKIRVILQGVLQQSEAGVPRWIRTTFDARDVKYVPVVLTSHPPKRRLSFSLDAMRYEVLVVLTNVRADIVPAK